MKTRKYGRQSFIRLVVSNQLDINPQQPVTKKALEEKCRADQWSPCPPTFENCSRLIEKAHSESDSIAWAAAMVSLKNMSLMGDI